jgi:hypothetical protein
LVVRGLVGARSVAIRASVALLNTINDESIIKEL